jgi:hypothetical protein
MASPAPNVPCTWPGVRKKLFGSFVIIIHLRCTVVVMSLPSALIPELVECLLLTLGVFFPRGCLLVGPVTIASFALGLCDQVMANCFVNASYNPQARNGTCPASVGQFYVR